MQTYISPLSHALLFATNQEQLTPEQALIVAQEGQTIYLTEQGKYIVAETTPEQALAVQTRPSLEHKVHDGQWVLPLVSAPTEHNEFTQGYVTISRFLRDLLTFPVYGAMEVAETGLSAKFAAGTATQLDIQLLGMFRAAKAWLNSSQTLNLTDPMVAQVLDACMVIPQIGLTQADKERILRNEAKPFNT